MALIHVALLTELGFYSCYADLIECSRMSVNASCFVVYQSASCGYTNSTVMSETYFEHRDY